MVKSNNSFKILLLLIISIILFQNIASADDWPMYQQNLQHTGFTIDAISPPLDIIWEKKATDNFRTGPVVADDVVYISSNDKKLYALYSKDKGKEIWVYQDNLENFHIVSNRIAVFNQTVYISSDGSSGSRYLSAIDAISGKLKWRYPTGQLSNFDPTIVNDIVFGSSGNKIFAIDATSGELRWKYNIEKNTRAQTPIFYNKTLFIVSNRGHLYALDLNGSLKWERQIAFSDREFTVPTLDNELIYIGSNRTLYAIDVSSGNIIWKFKTSDYIHSSTSGKGFVYIGSHYNFYAIDATSGKFKWRYPIDSVIIAPPVVANNTVFFGSTDGMFYAFDAITGTPKQKINFNARISYPIAISNNYVYVVSGQYLYALSASMNASGVGESTPTKTKYPEWIFIYFIEFVILGVLFTVFKAHEKQAYAIIIGIIYSIIVGPIINYLLVGMGLWSFIQTIIGTLIIYEALKSKTEIV